MVMKNRLPFLIGLGILLLPQIAFPDAVRVSTRGAVADGGPTDGSVCLGPYLAFFDETPHLSLVVDNSEEKIVFNHAEPRIVARGLDPQKRHKIRVFYDSTVVETLPISFVKLKTSMVDVWRSPGYWHLEPNHTGKCQWPREVK